MDTIISIDPLVDASQTSIPDGDDYNNGITIYGRVSLYNDPEYYPPNFDIVVLNNTDEPITFPNKGYGIEVYWGDVGTKKWRRIEIDSPLVDYNTPITLQAYSEKWMGDNMWILNGSDIKEFYHIKPVRVYVRGVGDISGKNYIAYWDVRDNSEAP